MRILIVEDEYYLAEDLALALAARGAEVVGPVGTLAEAGKLICSERIDLAVLDMNLRGEMSFAIADRLDAIGIPYVIATGYDADGLPERFRGRPRLEKPFHPERLADLVQTLV
jgi:DNA-binding response OmpR family regulator